MFNWFSHHRRRVLDVLISAALTTVLVLAGVIAYGKVQQYRVDHANLEVTIRILNHNLQQGKLELPPELRPPAPAQKPPEPAK